MEVLDENIEFLAEKMYSSYCTVCDGDGWELLSEHEQSAWKESASAGSELLFKVVESYLAASEKWLDVVVDGEVVRKKLLDLSEHEG